MSDADRDIANMKCWAVVVLICSIFSFNLAIFITGIVGASQVLCCASSNEQVARNAGCFKCCSMSCAIIAAIHALGAMILGAVMAGSVDPCTEKLTDSSCQHLDGRRRRLDSPPLGGVAAALSKGAIHAPLLLGIVTGGSGLLFPTSSLGAPTLAGLPVSRRLAGAPPVPRRLEYGGCDSVDDPDCDTDDTPCRDWGTDCCWGGFESEEQLACDPGYRPDLLHTDCFFGLGTSYECTPDESYRTRYECEEHMKDVCAENFAGATVFFFFWMAVELVRVRVRVRVRGRVKG
jgi:hypothetical protein